MTAAPCLDDLGLGTAALAIAPESTARACLDAAFEAGIRYFDTAPLYGGGQAEVRLGQALKDAPQDVRVSTKCGRYRAFGGAAPSKSGIEDTWDFSEAATRASVARSMDRLGRARLDAVFLHDLEAAPEQAFAEALPVLRALQADGHVGLVGAGCNTVAGLISALEAGAGDVVLVAGRWTLMDRSAGARLLPRAAALGTHVVAGGLLNSGCLSAPDAPDATFDYRPVNREERRLLISLKTAAQDAGVPLLSTALQFPGRDTRVATALLGAANATQLEASLEALRAPIPHEFWALVEGHGLAA